jgi:accessory gene regulator protein AgrB
MVVLVALFGVIIAALGIIFFAKPKTSKQYIAYWKQDKRLKNGAILSLLFGIIFLIVATECRLTGLIIILGVWSIIKGVLLLTLKKQKIYAYLDWWLNKPESTTRYIGLIAFAFGILLIYAA